MNAEGMTVALNVNVDAAEVAALKTEISGAIVRRLAGDGRSPTDLFGVAIVALGESAADMLFSAAHDRAHGEQLLKVFNTLIEARWRTLASLNIHKGENNG